MSRCCLARHGCLYAQKSWKDSFKYQERTSGEFQRTSVESRSFWRLSRFHASFSKSQRVPLKPAYAAASADYSDSLAC